MKFRGTFIPPTWTGTAVWLIGVAVLMVLTTAWSSPWWIWLPAAIAWAWAIHFYEERR